MTRALLLLSSSLLGFLLMTLTQSSPIPMTDASGVQPIVRDPTALRALQARYKSLTKQLTQLIPAQPYILVDTARNHLFIKRRDRVMLDALASTGSGTMLDKPGDSNSQWIFDTPRGEFYVQSKLVNPVWVKPDWAFVEEGLAVPKNQMDRMEPGVLGEYALGFGKGFFIHGTLYTRLLGKNVTHGCIRLNDDDLKSVYQLARVGTPIMIF
ncbi:MAG: L,D-transpeptidase family protein [Nitrospira sp. CR1.3]|nr:L,D-transpeptidase family protein [Nitrospira sp. CR1.3]